MTDDLTRAADRFDGTSTLEIVDRYLAWLSEEIAAGRDPVMPAPSDQPDEEQWHELQSHAVAWWRNRPEAVTGGAR